MGLTKSEYKVNRPTITAGLLEGVTSEFFARLSVCIKEKGDGAFISLGEIRGYLEEEFDEFCTEQHGNKSDAARRELMDVAVAAIWGIVSIDVWSHHESNS